MSRAGLLLHAPPSYHPFKTKTIHCHKSVPPLYNPFKPMPTLPLSLTPQRPPPTLHALPMPHLPHHLCSPRQATCCTLEMAWLRQPFLYHHFFLQSPGPGLYDIRGSTEFTSQGHRTPDISFGSAQRFAGSKTYISKLHSEVWSSLQTANCQLMALPLSIFLIHRGSFAKRRPLQPGHCFLPLSTLFTIHKVSLRVPLSSLTLSCLKSAPSVFCRMETSSLNDCPARFEACALKHELLPMRANCPCTPRCRPRGWVLTRQAQVHTTTAQ